MDNSQWAKVCGELQRTSSDLTESLAAAGKGSTTEALGVAAPPTQHTAPHTTATLRHHTPHTATHQQRTPRHGHNTQHTQHNTAHMQSATRGYLSQYFQLHDEGLTTTPNATNRYIQSIQKTTPKYTKSYTQHQRHNQSIQKATPMSIHIPSLLTTNGTATGNNQLTQNATPMSIHKPPLTTTNGTTSLNSQLPDTNDNHNQRLLRPTTTTTNNYYVQ